MWAAYRQHYGFEVDRIEATTANGASALCHSWGSRVTTKQIVAEFGPARKFYASAKRIAYHLSSLPGASVSFTAHDGTVYTGQAALAMLDGKDKDSDSTSRRTLDGPRPIEYTPKRTTLGGD